MIMDVLVAQRKNAAVTLDLEEIVVVTWRIKKLRRKKNPIIEHYRDFFCVQS